MNYHSSTLDTYVYLARSRASKVLYYIHIILIFIHVHVCTRSTLYAIALRNVMGGATMVIKSGQQNRQATPPVSEDSVSG